MPQLDINTRLADFTITERAKFGKFGKGRARKLKGFFSNFADENLVYILDRWTEDKKRKGGFCFSERFKRSQFSDFQSIEVVADQFYLFSSFFV
jgi:hypothetical protein